MSSASPFKNVCLMGILEFDNILTLVLFVTMLLVTALLKAALFKTLLQMICDMHVKVISDTLFYSSAGTICTLIVQNMTAIPHSFRQKVVFRRNLYFTF
jgi:hypothetical protein